MQKYDDENYVDNILKQDNDANEIQELRKFTVELYDYNEKKLKLFNTTFEDFILNYYDNKSTDKNKLNLILNLYKNILYFLRIMKVFNMIPIQNQIAVRFWNI